MLKFKCFEGDDEVNLERIVNKFLQENPTLRPMNMQCVIDKFRKLYLAVLFEEIPQFPKVDHNFIPAYPWPAQPIPVTCDDDPWKGQYIPVGDPPTPKPMMKDPPHPVNAMEQFGALPC